MKTKFFLIGALTVIISQLIFKAYKTDMLNEICGQIPAAVNFINLPSQCQVYLIESGKY